MKLLHKLHPTLVKENEKITYSLKLIMDLSDDSMSLLGLKLFRAKNDLKADN